MRKIWPFVGIALAVAAGIAVAPFFWWLALLGGLALVAWRYWRWWPVAGVLLVYGWPVWLASRHQYTDALFAALLVTVVLFWRAISARARPAWLKVFPE